MNRMQTFQEFLATQSVQVPVWGFLFNMCLVIGLSFILSRVYIRYGTSLSNRRLFAKNFMLITMTTMLVITIVKSSLALSLGLVGALSIVRFRAAIKEPEELAYLFFAIAIGLGFGADQRLITLVAFFVICGVLILRARYHAPETNQNLHLTVKSRNPKKVSLEKITEILKGHCQTVDIKRFDESKEILEAAFLVEFDDLKQLQKAKASLQELHDSLEITFLDNKGIF